MSLADVFSGGNDPAVVFPDVDVDKVAEKVTSLIYLANEYSVDWMIGCSLCLPQLGSGMYLHQHYTYRSN